MELPPADQLLASAARFLIDGQEELAARVLLSCTLRVWQSGDSWFVGDETHYALHVRVTGPRAAYDILLNDGHPITAAIRRALDAILPEDTYIKHFTLGAELVQIDPDWRAELLEIARGEGVHNQAATADKARIWANLRFRSQAEIRVAKVLDERGLLFLPNCLARLSTPEGRRNREPDFLVCHEGKWGILEVDGEPFHPPSRAAQDHERDRLFLKHGVRFVQHFDATECYEAPHKVVDTFLELLARS